MHFSSWYTFRPQKTEHGTLFFLGANESGAAILFYRGAKLNSMMMLKLSISGDKGVICWHVRAESSTANLQNIKTHVRMLIDFPSCISSSFLTFRIFWMNSFDAPLDCFA
jgi:hypothetical protein